MAGSNLLCLPFPKKLWRLVNSSRFTSIWWEKDRTSIGLNEKLFQKEILEQDGSEKVFETDCMKSFIRQLNLYGFSKLDQDMHKSVCLSNCFTREWDRGRSCPEQGNVSLGPRRAEPRALECWGRGRGCWTPRNQGPCPPGAEGRRRVPHPG